jgi:hypothetical protein
VKDTVDVHALEQKLGIKQVNDWYKVSAKELRKELSIVKEKYGSFYNMLQQLYPHHNWDPIALSKQFRDVWRDKNAQRKAIEEMGKSLGIKELNDWHKVTGKDVSSLTFISRYYNGSLIGALKELYPQHDWNSELFHTKGYWNDENAQREALEKFGREHLGVKELDDWNHVNVTEVPRKLHFIKSRYNGSVTRALQHLYPHHDWKSLKPPKTSKGYWNDIGVQRDALEKYGREHLGVKELDDWYSVLGKDVELPFIKTHYRNSLYEALAKLYPQRNWDPLRFVRVPVNYWSSKQTQREELERVGREKFGVKTLNDWYTVAALNRNEVLKELKFIKKEYGSLCSALKSLIPEHKWDPLRFPRVSQGYWKEPEVVQSYHNLFLQWKNENNIQKVSDWYLLPTPQLRLLHKVSKSIFGTTSKMLRTWFPETGIVRDNHQQSELQVER